MTRKISGRKRLALRNWEVRRGTSRDFCGRLHPNEFAAGGQPQRIGARKPLLSGWAIPLLGVVCAVLSELFSSLDPKGSFIRLGFETLALGGCGLFAAELIRNRRLTLEAQERLRILVETSPAAIVTIDERGFIELANRAATELIAPRDGQLVGQPIAAFLPELHHALRIEEGPQFRASMQCRGHRGNGEFFLAEVWFSTFKEGRAPKLAAIIAEVTEESPPVGS